MATSLSQSRMACSATITLRRCGRGTPRRAKCLRPPNCTLQTQTTGGRTQTRLDLISRYHRGAALPTWWLMRRVICTGCGRRVPRQCWRRKTIPSFEVLPFAFEAGRGGTHDVNLELEERGTRGKRAARCAAAQCAASPYSRAHSDIIPQKPRLRNASAFPLHSHNIGFCIIWVCIIIRSCSEPIRIMVTQLSVLCSRRKST